MQKITYKSSGVNVEAGNEFAGRLKKVASKTSNAGAISEIGGFGGLFDIKRSGFKDPILVSSTDGVGTKVILALELQKYDTVGIDLVAMNVNDVLTCGARPLFFLDYLGIGKLKLGKYVKVVQGVAKGCKMAGCALIGGETAEMPDMYDENEFDLAGFTVGAVERDQLISGKDIAEGDAVIGIKSSGFHSNGYSLIRKVIKAARLDLKKRYEGFEETLGELLLEPTRIYVKEVLSLLDKATVKGMAHITGGSFKDKLGRIIPIGLCAVINRNSWNLPSIFKFIQKKGKIEESEMYSTFNCGIGYVLVVNPDEARKVMDHFEDDAVEIGYVEKGENKVSLI